MIAKPRLLVADDCPATRKEILKILEDEYELVEATSGDEAWNMLSTDKDIKMVLTDLTMHDSNGLTLLKRIRADQNVDTRTMPVIIMTEASDDVVHVKESLASGVTDLLRKPFVPELLRARASANVRVLDESKHLITATVDPLTQLANEPYFMLRGANNLAYAVRHNQGFGVLLIAVDKLTELRKQHEPYVIEGIQVKIGTYISSVVRAEDTVARLDDGMYGVLLMGVTPEGVLETSNRILQKVKKKIFRHSDQRFTVTISIGAASPVLKSYSSFEMILRQASAELRRAVEIGGDRVEAGNIQQRLTGHDRESQYVPTLDEALEMLGNNKSKMLEHCAEELFAKLLPLLMFCDRKMQLSIVEQYQSVLKSRIGDIV
ncbi:MAG TPA: response regulator [Gammaproteobacteria bacterium]